MRKNSDTTLWHELLHLFGPFCTKFCKETKRSSIHPKYNKTHQNISLGSNGVDRVLFWCVSYYLDAFGTIWLPHETRCKTGRTSAKVRARSRIRIFRNECTRSTPLDPKLMFWCVLFYLGALRTVWLPYKTWCKTGRTSAKVRATKLCRNFFATNAPEPPHWTLN